jgi:hypothetical protein
MKKLSLVIILIYSLSFAKNKIANINYHHNPQLECGEYTLKAWVKFENETAFLLVSKGSEGEIKFSLPYDVVPQILSLEDQAFEANILLTNNTLNYIKPINKKWLKPRIPDFREENQISELIKLKQRKPCQ